jgi:hypothetical protein
MRTIASLTVMVNKSTSINKEVIVRFVDTGGIVDHHC